MLAVICHSAGHADDQPATSNRMAAPTWTEVHMFPQNAIVLFMYADGILNDDGDSVVPNIHARLIGRVRSGINSPANDVKNIPYNVSGLSNRSRVKVRLPVSPCRIRRCYEYHLNM
jgi:predicted CxxxxCH...CXXCH cytochrome family protein